MTQNLDQYFTSAEFKNCDSSKEIKIKTKNKSNGRNNNNDKEPYVPYDFLLAAIYKLEHRGDLYYYSEDHKVVEGNEEK